MKIKLKVEFIAVLIFAYLVKFDFVRAQETTNVAHGHAIFQTYCTMCHSLTSNQYGPRLGDIYGRRVASVTDYRYSKPLLAQNWNWGEGELDVWLTSPQKMVKGTKMPIAIKDARDRADLIAYLKTLKLN